ncbi:RidA family protein [Sphingobium sp.]|uniref:RidA family protein n=1 Tax=Sphingobium sp. TaxID=1912891 RepID=UPI0028BD7E29|nr:RidA family protein [Sphingobium sp.]
MPLPIESIMTKSAPQPAGHYSQATRANGFIFVSGQLPVNAEGVPQFMIGFEEQVELALSNIKEILTAARTDTDHLARVTAYIVGVENWPKFNAVYAKFLPEVRPARTVVPVTELHHGCLVEIDAIALESSNIDE